MENTESIGQSHFERKWHRQNLNVEGRFDLRLDVKYPHLGTINELYEMVPYWEMVMNKKKEYPRAIRNWPEEDRPREKLLKYGEHVLSNAELLAILIDRKSVV